MSSPSLDTGAAKKLRKLFQSSNDREKVIQLLTRVEADSKNVIHSLRSKADDINARHRIAKCNGLFGQLLGFAGWVVVIVGLITDQPDDTERMLGIMPVDRITGFGLLVLSMGLVFVCASDIILDILVRSKIDELHPLIVRLQNSICELNKAWRDSHDAAEVLIVVCQSDTTQMFVSVLKSFKSLTSYERTVNWWQRVSGVLAVDKWLRIVVTIIMITCGLVLARMTPVNSFYVYQDIRQGKEHPTATQITECTIVNLEEQIVELGLKRLTLSNRVNNKFTSLI